ncbi:glycolate oxidase iron-sulfur subunit [Dyella nitratireducens]|uniref:Glycolate oxidase iron-sulfur subunit n=2 Tax=Dyella nitratireducens TaxID=1849580 RepID=A0ABQ1FPN5_9GAMM|nr:glycolate oxidase iron-sulfur subunit [Dyella nitratireducens]GLQ43881.1 glycolate oxidase iron-sulfur subunit [Dyella nitratireducens]
MPLENPRHRIAVLADQCVQCGLCLPVCPTYALDGNETESPRGRIAIAAALARDQVSPSDEVRGPLDHCLGCLSCERVCPAGVKYEELLLETRTLLGPAPERPKALLGLVKRPRLNHWAQRLARWPGVRQWLAPALPNAWRAALALMPEKRKATRSTSPVPNSRGKKAGTVALFPGCAASIHDADAEHAAEMLLTAAGYRVIRLPAFCCGALDLHDGAIHEAEAAATHLRQAWTTAGADYLVTVTPGCLSTLRRALPAVRVDDPYRLLAERIDELAFQPLPARFALHVPCTQANVARSDATLMTLLKRIPQLELKRLPAPPYCCGAAGSHVLQFPERAAQLRESVLMHMKTLDVRGLLSSNIGCRLHLAAGLEETASALPTLHPLTLLAQQWIPS